MDVLSNWLKPSLGHLMRVHIARTGGTWGVRLDPQGPMLLRVMMTGGCWVRAEGFEPIRFDVGDVLLIRSVGHELVSDPDQRAVSKDDFNRSLNGYDGPVTQEIICAAYDTDIPQSTFPPLPPLVHVPAARIAEIPRVQSLLTAICEEARAPGVGSEMMMGHLMDALLLSTVRSSYLKCGKEHWITSMRDGAVVRALQLLHDDFARRWTVEDLAVEVGLSRAVLARRFVQSVGMPPLSYLAAWRMKVAARCLANRDDGLAQIAVTVGYESEASFSRAFKREFGLAPDEFRRIEKDVIRRVDSIPALRVAQSQIG
ncbi:AraC family transcriptional regulator [Pseudooceanicola sp. MF1-13]|uniref:AraC family transcriptional regulator n=1 Tax=Pseudooceanicola sp. MF1-13 TaxID=3379095 RepID=UPI003891BED6